MASVPAVNGMNGPSNAGAHVHTHNLTAERFPAFVGKPSEDGCGHLTPPDLMGPMLQYNGMSLIKQCWNGSVLYVIKNGTLGTSAPCLVVSDGADVTVQGVNISTFQCWTFWRFEVNLPLMEAERKVTYRLDGVQEAWDFHIAGQAQSFNWSYYSCAGFSSDMPESERKMGFGPLWDELMRRHNSKPYHLLFGGGDQLYNDMVFRLHSVGTWMHQDHNVRDAAPFSQEMKEEAEGYYFTHYMVHYNMPTMRHVVARIPQLMMWDDHDIFDGFGSYPQGLQDSEAFIGLYQVARRFYLLFQNQTTDALAEQHGMIRQGTALSRLALLGPQTALLAADMRSERLRAQIMPKGAWAELVEHLRALPSSVKHVVVGSGVPVVYPSLAEVESLLESVSDANRTGAGGCIRCLAGVVGKSKFDEPELLDDLLDHWTAETHLEEKREMIEQFQALAKCRSIRISFVSGDVHLCATGRLRTPHKLRKEHDHKYMLQVVSSAITNRPPPDGLVTFLSQKALHNHTLMPGTQERMRATFGGFASVRAKLMNKRNFCTVHEDKEHGGLVFTLVVEQAHGVYKEYPSTAPLLKVDDGSKHMSGKPKLA